MKMDEKMHRYARALYAIRILNMGILYKCIFDPDIDNSSIPFCIHKLLYNWVDLLNGIIKRNGTWLPFDILKLWSNDNYITQVHKTSIIHFLTVTVKIDWSDNKWLQNKGLIFTYFLNVWWSYNVSNTQ